jgi:hypothetical protein
LVVELAVVVGPLGIVIVIGKLEDPLVERPDVEPASVVGAPVEDSDGPSVEEDDELPVVGPGAHVGSEVGIEINGPPVRLEEAADEDDSLDLWVEDDLIGN